MKQILKIIGSLLIGMAFGLLVGGILVIFFTDVSMGEFFEKFKEIDLSEGLSAVLVAFAAVVLSVPLLVVLHEAGHLICGLTTGYKFVSFRIFNLTFIRTNGKLRIKHFSIAGTGGQCLLSPPDLPINRVPTGWYNIGGVLANIVALACVLPLLLTEMHPFVREFLAVFCLIDVFMVLLNGIPMKAGGIGNDAYNMMKLHHDPKGKRAIVMQLRANALVQSGVRPKDMPEEWFEMPDVIDYSNPLQVSMPMMAASRLLDKMEWEKSYEIFNALYAHKGEIMKLYVNEIACELLFLAIMTGRMSQAKELWTDALKKYVTTYSRVMSSKQRVLAAVELYLNDNRGAAGKIYDQLKTDAGKYLLQGEVDSDVAIMERMLGL